MRKLLSFVLCLLPPVVAAQTAARVGGPVSGIVFDRNARALRPMLGIPGASYLGDAILEGIQAAAVSPDGQMALATADGRVLLIGGLNSAVPTSAPLDVLAGDVFAWSPDGSSAAIYSAAAGQAQILREVRGNMAPSAFIEVPGTVTALAVSDAGDLVVGLESGLHLLAPGAAPRSIALIASPSAVAFRGRDLFAAGAGQIRLVENFASSPSASVLVEDAGRVVGLQLSADARRLFAADAANRLLKAFDLSTRTAAGQAALDCAPSELRAFGAGNAWLLNSDTNGSEPLYVGTGAGEPAAWFVPAGRAQ